MPEKKIKLNIMEMKSLRSICSVISGRGAHLLYWRDVLEFAVGSSVS